VEVLEHGIGNLAFNPSETRDFPADSLDLVFLHVLKDVGAGFVAQQHHQDRRFSNSSDGYVRQ